MELYRASNGDTAVLEDKSIVVRLNGRRGVLSTSSFGGGYREDITAVFNHDGTSGADKRYRMLADTYEEHMQIVAEELGLDAQRVTGMDTAAQMVNAALATESYRALTVTAIVTGGVDDNGGRAGDAADFYEPQYIVRRLGTINIILLIGADLSSATLARALVTCTEAKTAALQELLAGSCYSEGIATGSGTDQTIIIADRDAEIRLTDAGKHSKLGELIGRCVTAAVKRALEKQTGLSGDRQFSVRARLKRFGAEQIILSDEERARLDLQDRDARCVTDASLLAHLIDQHRWGLLGKRDAISAITRLTDALARDRGVEPPTITEVTIEPFLRLLTAMPKRAE